MGVSFWAWPVSILVGVLISYFTYKNLIAKSRTWIIPATLRFLGVGLLVWLLFNPTLILKSTRFEKPIVQIFGDFSSSCKNESIAVIKTLDSLIMSRYGNRVDIQRVAFKENLVYVNSWDSVGNESVSELTRLDLVQQDLNSVKDEVAGSIIVTDGIVNKGQSPLLQGKTKQPLIIIGVGDTFVYNDFAIESIHSNQEVFEGNATQIEIDVKAIQCAGIPSIIEVYDGRKLISKTAWTPKSKIDREKISLTVKSQKEQLKLTATIKSNKLNEDNKLNNNLVKIIDVVKSKKEVWLIYGKLNPDIKVLSEIISNSNRYHVTSIIEENVKGIFGDICIFHGVQKSQLIQECSNKDIPFWTFLTTPSSIVVANRISGAQISGMKRDQWQTITAYPNGFFNDFLIPESTTISKWGGLESPIVKASALEENIQFYQSWNNLKTDYPLFFKSANQKNQLWFLGENIWKWKLQNSRITSGNKVFKDWVIGNINWLSLSTATRKGINVNIGSGEWVVGQENNISLLEKDASGKLRMDTKLKVEIFDSTGKKTDVQIVKNANFQIINFKPISSGMHTLRVSSDLNPTPTNKFWFVKNQSIEKTNNVARFDLLRNWANHNGGHLYMSTNLKAVMERLADFKLDSKRSYQYSKQMSFNELVFTLIFLILCFSIEWFLRKWFGKI